MLPAPVTLKPVSSPNLKLHLAVAIDQLGVGAVGRDEAGAVGAGGEGDENIGVQVTEFMRLEASIRADFGQYLARLRLILFRRS